jgi:glutamate-ammonia-ligase adenylyltransferase
MRLLGTSALVPDLLVRAPEVLRLLAAPLAGHADELQRDPAEFAASLRLTVARQSDPDTASATARSLRRHEMLRVACADLLGLLSTEQVCAALSSVWVAGLAATLESVQRALAGNDAGRPARIAVIGMAVSAGPSSATAATPTCCSSASRRRASEQDAVRYANLVAETVRRRLGSASPDPALVVDADLRPEGRNGPFVRTLESLPGLLRAGRRRGRRRRCAAAAGGAGDVGLGARFVEMIDPVRYPAEGLGPATVTRSGGSKRVDAERRSRRRGPHPAHEARSRWARRRRVDGAACCSCSTRAISRAAHHLDASRACAGAGEAGLLTAEDVSELTAEVDVGRARGTR